jgi:hypothetical protein
LQGDLIDRCIANNRNVSADRIAPDPLFLLVGEFMDLLVVPPLVEVLAKCYI